jgi:hypothetical protein
MKAHYRLIDADTGQEVETFDPWTIALAKGDPDMCRLLNELARLAMSAYVPACRLTRDYNRMRRVLARYPGIRRCRLTPRRLLIHAGDWLAHAPVSWTDPDLTRQRGDVAERYLAYLGEIEERRRKERARRRNPRP